MDADCGAVHTRQLKTSDAYFNDAWLSELGEYLGIQRKLIWSGWPAGISWNQKFGDVKFEAETRIPQSIPMIK